MSIFDSVSGTIKRYGCKVAVSENGKSSSTTAFVEPFQFKSKIYVGGEYISTGLRNTEKYLYIGPVDCPLSMNSSVIETQAGKYIVKRCETYYVMNRPVYVWAILLPYGEALEDDYESD
ncbi:MAG: hypothetical protein LUF33_06025 [Clostridiales bacterium]|nr:hypothetical protein [Clostridiales bacterium]